MRSARLPQATHLEVVKGRGPLRCVLVTARPRQWVKNLFVLAPLAFAKPDNALHVARVGIAFVAFCLAASALYFVNDVADRELDRKHRRKRFRPVASGELPVSTAVAVAVLLLVVALPLGLLASLQTFGLLAAYVAATLSYSWGLKNVAILDVMLVASGFVIRVAAGSYAGGFGPSEWLLICTGFLALFLGFGKRRHELLLLGDAAAAHRPTLGQYTTELLDQFLSASTMGAIVSYALYTLTSEAARANRALILTVPFVVYSVFRYLLLVQTKDGGGAPEDQLLTDRPMQLAILLWGITAFLVVYWHRIF